MDPDTGSNTSPSTADLIELVVGCSVAVQCVPDPELHA